jgi:hypothetical protein
MHYIQTCIYSKVMLVLNSSDECFILGTGLCRMGILAIVITRILESFQIIICHRSNFNSESCCFLLLLSILHPFNVVCLFVFCLFFSHFFNVFVYLYLVVNLSNEWNPHDLHKSKELPKTGWNLKLPYPARDAQPEKTEKTAFVLDLSESTTTISGTCQEVCCAAFQSSQTNELWHTWLWIV